MDKTSSIVYNVGMNEWYRDLIERIETDSAGLMRYYRKERTRQELAEELGVSASLIAKIEEGKRRISMGLLRKMMQRG